MIQTSTKNDVTRERFVYGAELVGKYQFPLLPKINADLTTLHPVPFNSARKEKNPKQSVCHFFTHDCEFEKLWTYPEKYCDMLYNFRYVCAPDFSVYSNMPLALQIYQVYRSRALAWWLSLHGIDVIPTVTWSDVSSFDFCFDGLPERSTLAISTNGCHSKEGVIAFQRGFAEMERRLKPCKLLIVGKPIDVPTGAQVVYMDSQSVTVARKLSKGGDDNGR